MKKPLELALTKLNQAWSRLNEGAAIAKTDLDQDGVIQRFEFTFELLWKCLKIFFEDKGLEAKSPRDSLKVAFRLGWIKGESEALFLNMLEDQNRSSHIYNQQEAGAIYGRIHAEYLPAIKALIDRLEKED